MSNFDSMAKNFDTDKRIQRTKMIADTMRPYIDCASEKSAMEYGCGTGILGFEFIDDFKSIIFVDSSSGMIDEVKAKLSRLGKSADSALCCDFSVNVPSDLKVDYIFSSFTFHHIKDIKMILSNLYSLLNEGGHLLVVDMDKNDHSFHPHGFDGHNGFEQSSLIEMSKAVGFSKAEAKSFYHDVKIANGIKIPYSLFIFNAEK